MTDLNEKLKLVSEYDELQKDNYGKFFKGGVFKGYNVNEFKYHTSYDWQIPVWQKVYKEMFEYDYTNKLIEFDRGRKISNLYKNMVNNGTPLESFEILVEAIQFINKMKK
jgi:hypothetical protein